MTLRMLISLSRLSSSLLVSFWRDTALIATGVLDFCSVRQPWCPRSDSSSSESKHSRNDVPCTRSQRSPARSRHRRHSCRLVRGAPGVGGRLLCPCASRARRPSSLANGGGREGRRQEEFARGRGREGTGRSASGGRDECARSLRSGGAWGGVGAGLDASVRRVQSGVAECGGPWVTDGEGSCTFSGARL